MPLNLNHPSIQGQVQGLELQVQGPKAREQGPEFQNWIELDCAVFNVPSNTV